MSKVIIYDYDQMTITCRLLICKKDEKWLREELKKQGMEMSKARSVKDTPLVNVDVRPRKDEDVETIGEFLKNHEDIDASRVP